MGETHKLLAYLFVIPFIFSCNNLANTQVRPLAEKIEKVKQEHKNPKRIFVKGKGFISKN